MGIFNTVLTSAAGGAGSGLFGGLLTISIGGVSLMTLLSALIVFVICFVAMRLITRLASRALAKSRLEGALRNFVLSCVKAALWLLTAVIVADKLGIPSASLVALVSVAGLALSLSLQDTLKNVFSGFTILFTRPFSSGDYVEIGATAGTVAAIWLFYTTLMTADGKEISIPNSEVCSSRVTDYTREPERRVELGFDVGYDCAAEEVRAALLAAAAADGRALAGEGKDPSVVLSEYKSSSIRYLLRFWVRNSDYWDAYYAVNESAREYLAKAGLGMAYDRLDVKLIQK